MTKLARAVFVLLVGATFAAFFAAQRIKGEPAVAQVVSLTRVFSPNGDSAKEINRFEVELRERSEISVDVVDTNGDAVRRLAEEATVGPDAPLELAWDGRTDAGERVPDGRYRVRVTLRREGRSVVVPRTTLVDTKPPRPRVKTIDPGPIVAPGAGPIRIEVGSVSNRLVKRATVYRIDGGPARVVAELAPVRNTRTIEWDGTVDGKPAPIGTYVVQVSARDRAGNTGTAPAEVPAARGDARGRPGMVVRGIAAEPPARPVTAGEEVRVNVDARGRHYRWRLRRVGRPRPVSNGRGAPGEPVGFTAPSGDSGLYLLELRTGSGRYRTSVPVLVQSRTRARMLVVVPTITWTGTQLVDEYHNGVVNTLETGSPVSWPRVQPAGLPADLYATAAPLLRFLDRAQVRYDITTDLDLALSRSPRASDRPGVLLAGSERWISRAYGRRLRRYVLEGGRVATFGPETLRRGVAILRNRDSTAGRLVRPTQPSIQDPFGTRFEEEIRREPQPVTLTLIGGDAGYGLLEGFDGALTGFSVLEEADAPSGERGELLAALGVETITEETEEVPDELPPEPKPALAATRLGEGLLIRVGLPEWTQRLDDRQVAQITRNIADLLRGLDPEIRSVD
ncbi:MAG TPA: FlgD immunoglobulin-like domain containing protein [Solirubrobacteraceae bacterium]|nr:FlgD immunoglobulin-like domain containing protein [Solirubrobacteraceae bacterium]